MLNVNLSKTNVIVFRNGGHTRGNAKLYLNHIQVQPCIYYKYLGIVFSSSLIWSVPLKRLPRQASKAMSVVRNIQHLCGCVPVEVCFILFYKIIAPSLLYGSKMWSYEVRKDIEDIHVNVYKYVMGVANFATFGECGRLPLSVMYMTLCIKYWLRIAQVYDGKRYPKCCYDILYQLGVADRHTWATGVKNMLYRFGFGHVWLSQGI